MAITKEDKMQRAKRPRSGHTTYHRNGDVTVWNCMTGQWERGNSPSDRLFSTMSYDERNRVLRHTTYLTRRELAVCVALLGYEPD
jgi:hypothetical protein